MRTKFKRVEQVSGVLLFLAISAFIFLKADSPDTETTVYYLAGTVILWAVSCFLYVFIRDAVIALRWKKPAFPLPQYEKEDAEMERLRKEDSHQSFSLSNFSDPHDPSWHLFDK